MISRDRSGCWCENSDHEGEKPVDFRHTKEVKVKGARGRAVIPGYTSDKF